MSIICLAKRATVFEARLPRHKGRPRSSTILKDDTGEWASNGAKCKIKIHTIFKLPKKTGQVIEEDENAA